MKTGVARTAGPARRVSGVCLALALAAALGAGCQAPQARVPPPEVVPDVAPGATAREVSLGESVEGRPLTLHVFGEPGAGPAVFIFGGIHGDEPVGVALAERLIGVLRERPALSAGRTVALLSCANPDGLAAGRRGNARGVDCNRNFPATNFKPAARNGPHPASEPETQAILKALEMLRPARVVSIHACPRGQHGVNYDGPAETLARAMAAGNGYRAFGTWFRPTPGSLGSYAGVDRGIAVITLEVPRDLTAEAAWNENRETLLAAIEGDAPLAPPAADTE